MSEVLVAICGDRGRWPVIGFWALDQPIIGQCGLVLQVGEHPWCSYVVMPFGQQEGDDGWWRKIGDFDKWEYVQRRCDA